MSSMVIGKPSQILYNCSLADNPLYYHRSKPHLWFLTGYGPLGCSTYRYSNTVTRQQQLNSSRPNQAKSIQKVQRNQYFTEVATMKTITLWSLLGLALLSFQIVHANEDQVKKIFKSFLKLVKLELFTGWWRRSQDSFGQDRVLRWVTFE